MGAAAKSQGSARSGVAAAGRETRAAAAASVLLPQAACWLCAHPVLSPSGTIAAQLQLHPAAGGAPAAADPSVLTQPVFYSQASPARPDLAMRVLPLLLVRQGVFEGLKLLQERRTCVGACGSCAQGSAGPEHMGQRTQVSPACRKLGGQLQAPPPPMPCAACCPPSPAPPLQALAVAASPLATTALKPPGKGKTPVAFFGSGLLIPYYVSAAWLGTSGCIGRLLPVHKPRPSTHAPPSSLPVATIDRLQGGAMAVLQKAGVMTEETPLSGTSGGAWAAVSALLWRRRRSCCTLGHRCLGHPADLHRRCLLPGALQVAFKMGLNASVLTEMYQLFMEGEAPGEVLDTILPDDIVDLGASAAEAARPALCVACLLCLFAAEGAVAAPHSHRPHLIGASLPPPSARLSQRHRAHERGAAGRHLHQHERQRGLDD